MARRRTACTSRSPGSSTSRPTSSSPASTSAPTWATTRSTRAHSRRPPKVPMLLNVNVPDVAPAALRGIEVTRLGKRHKAEPVVKLQTPRGETAYWIGPAGAAADAGPGTDFHAVEACCVSVTPLRMDLTHN